MATIQTFPETKNAPANRYPAEYDVISINGRSGTVLSIYGDHAGIEVEHDEDDDHPWRLVTYRWVEGRGWMTGAMLQLTLEERKMVLAGFGLPPELADVDKSKCRSIDDPTIFRDV